MGLLHEGEKVTPKSVDDWICLIESSWKNLPEFKVDSQKLQHLAIICDGNRRSAQKKGLDPWQGHRLGLEVIRGLMQACKKWEIKYLTIWVWSTENWERDQNQVNFVMDLAARYLNDEEMIKPFIENEVNFRHLGRSDRLPEKVRQAIISLEERTAGFDNYFVNLAMDYGGVDEIARAVASLVDREVKPEEITANPQIIFDFLDTAGQPPPDLVIRTGHVEGEIPHTSGFMPLQTGYAAWQFLPDLFPDLTPQTLMVALKDFLEYERRRGR